MIYESDVSSLISKWRERLGSKPPLNPAYIQAMTNCISDLSNLLDGSLLQEARAYEKMQQEYFDQLPYEEAREMLQEEEADWFNSSLDTHFDKAI